MAKVKTSKFLKTPKLPKWCWWGLWFVGVFLSILIILFTLFHIWVSTWQTYKNDEFGFSFRYPSNWHISGNPITKEYFDVGRGIFWIDRLPELPSSGQDVVKSQGNVEVYTSPKLDEYDKVKSVLNYQNKQFGNRNGFFMERKNRSSSLGGLLTLRKESIVKTDSYVFVINTVSNAKDQTFFSKITAKFYYLIGSTIVDSFEFD